MSDTERSKIIKRPWSRSDAIREKRRREKISEIVAATRERWANEHDREIRKQKYTGKVNALTADEISFETPAGQESEWSQFVRANRKGFANAIIDDTTPIEVLGELHDEEKPE